MLRLVEPQYFVPVHGEYRMLVAHGELAQRVGVESNNVFILEDGDVLEIDASGAEVVGQVPGGHVYVDGLRMWDVRNPVLRDRRMLSRDGFVLVVIPIDHATGELYGAPEIVSSGFLNPDEGGQLIEQASDLVIESLKNPNGQLLDDDYVTGRVRETVGRFLYAEPRRRPMIVALPLEV